jgi:predicted aminopeptidase
MQKEGPDSSTLKKVRLEHEDQKIFSKFISAELQQLRDWYKQIPLIEKSEEVRQKRINQIKIKFMSDIAPQLKTTTFQKFSTLNLNNARLLIYKTYMEDLEDFEKLYDLVGKNFSLFIEKCKALEKSEDPAKHLKKIIETLKQN